MKKSEYSATFTSDFQKKYPEVRPTFKSRLHYLVRLIMWMIKHRNEKDCRQKWRRFDRDLMTLAFVIGSFLLASIDWTVIAR